MVNPAPGSARPLRFACSRCGACCNRSPEVELAEAGALADMFVFRLMFRLYLLPRNYAGYLASGRTADSSDGFHESKRLPNAFAVRKSTTKRVHAGKPVEYTNYLTISALTLDAGLGVCSALNFGRCGIYDRRPLACRTVPFHYSRPEASAERDLAEFAARPGYLCDTSAGAPVVLEGGRIVDAEWRSVRGSALDYADQGRSWRDAILRAMKSNPGNKPLPSLAEIEANAAYGVTTTSMRVAWEIAVHAGLMSGEECERLVTAQAETIDRALTVTGCVQATRDTLLEMRAEYRKPLNG